LVIVVHDIPDFILYIFHFCKDQKCRGFIYETLITKEVFGFDESKPYRNDVYFILGRRVERSARRSRWGVSRTEPLGITRYGRGGRGGFLGQECRSTSLDPIAIDSQTGGFFWTIKWKPRSGERFVNRPTREEWLYGRAE
jgi:hypothetical protein